MVPHFDVTVGDEGHCGGDRLEKGDPINELGILGKGIAELQIAVQIVYRKLVDDEEVCDEQFVLRAARTARRKMHELTALRRERIKGSLTNSRSDEEAPKKPFARKREKPGVHARC